MILVGGEPVVKGNAAGETESLLLQLLEHPVLVASANALGRAEPQTIKAPRPSGNEDFDRRPNVDDIAELQSDAKYVYLFQKEFATACPLFVELIGTDEVTTCIGLVIRDPSSGLTSVGHFDTTDCVFNGVNELVNGVVSLSSITFQVHLIGAFDDSSEYSGELGSGGPTFNAEFAGKLKRENARQKFGWSLPLALKMIETLQESVHDFEVETCCILSLNTSIGPTGHPCPTVRGFVVETSSGRLLPSYFEPEARCPDGTVRGLGALTADRQWVATLVSPYDTVSDTYRISPFKWSLEFERYAYYMLNLQDEAFMETFSTSPYAESSWFLPTSRRIFTYLINRPHWEQTFPNNQPRIFTRTSTGGWARKHLS